jgi:nucleoid-associated protein YejK
MTPLQQLKEDYERRANTATDMFNDISDLSNVVKMTRLLTKRSLYLEFAQELGRLMQEETNRPNLADLPPGPAGIINQI